MTIHYIFISAIFIIKAEGDFVIKRDGTVIKSIEDFPYLINKGEIEVKNGELILIDDFKLRIIKLKRRSKVKIEGDSLEIYKNNTEIEDFSDKKVFNTLSRFERVGGIVLRGNEKYIKCIYPAFGVKIKETRPTFKFRVTFPCEFSLYEVNKDSLIFSDTVKGNFLQYPYYLPDLQRGKTYIWELRKGYLSDRGVFYILTEDEIEKISRIVKEADKKTLSEKILIGFTLEKYGFLEEALQLYEKIKKDVNLKEKIEKIKTILGSTQIKE